MRVTLPNLKNPIQVNSAAISLISLFTQDLFAFIDKGLTQTIGKNWLDLMQMQNLGSELNYKDPAILLKELVQKGQSPLRRPISALVPKANWKDFYNRLQDLLDERNSWVHNANNADPDSLKSLVLLVNKVAFYLELPVTKECKDLNDLISPIDVPETSTPEPEAEKPADEEIQLGTPLAGPFLGYSYTLHMDGSIRDRSTDQLLTEFNQDYEALGMLLIARKPSGGRLKITAGGQIAAYFGNYWGYLGAIEGKKWFPGHLK